MKNYSISFLCAALGLSVLAHLDGRAARADWEGRLIVQGTEKGAEGSGKMYAKGSKVRFDMTGQGQEMVIVADSEKREATMMMPAQKIAMNLPEAARDQQMITCSTADVDGCYKRKGYKQVGKETIDGHPCLILEGDEKQGKISIHQKIWRPTDLKEVFMLKGISHIGDGKVVTTQIKGVKMSKLSDSLFSVPADYKKMEMPTLPGAQ